MDLGTVDDKNARLFLVGFPTEKSFENKLVGFGQVVNSNEGTEMEANVIFYVWQSADVKLAYVRTNQELVLHPGEERELLAEYSLCTKYMWIQGEVWNF